MNAFDKGIVGGIAGSVGADIEMPRVKTRPERLADWRNTNRKAYEKAHNSCCVCSPTRAEMLLVQQYEGYGPPDV